MRPTFAQLWLRILCGASCIVLTAAWRLASAIDGLGGSEEPPHVKLLRLGGTIAGAALLAQLVLSDQSGSHSTPLELPADPILTLREDKGVSTLVPVHIDRAKTSEPPILEGTSRMASNSDNPRGLSFLSAAATAAPATAPATPVDILATAVQKPLPQYTLEEVAKHCTREDAWVIIDERVYDVSGFIDRHPGGAGPILNLAGKDCTDVFSNYHAQRIYKTMLPAMLVGEMAAGEIVVWPHVADFRRVRQELLRRGLFETDMRFYAKMFCWIMLLFTCALYLSLGSQSTTARMVGAGVMGIFWQQLAGIGHDIGHSAITHSFHTDHAIGSLLATIMGLSTCWWKSNHNTHHVACNAIEHDPNMCVLKAGVKAGVRLMLVMPVSTTPIIF